MIREERTPASYINIIGHQSWPAIYWELRIKNSEWGAHSWGLMCSIYMLGMYKPTETSEKYNVLASGHDFVNVVLRIEIEMNLRRNKNCTIVILLLFTIFAKLYFEYDIAIWNLRARCLWWEDDDKFIIVD